MAGYATPAWSNDQSPAIDDAALLDIGHGIEIAEHPYGVCSTAAATAAKTVTIDYSGTLTLFAGLTIRVKFTNGNTAASPTLNVNGTGAVSIMKFGVSAVSSFAWNAGLVVTFVYDGTNWLMDSRPESVGLLNGGIVLTNSDDMDNCQESGWYLWNNTAAPANAPFTTSYGALYVDHAGANTKQTVFRATLPGVTGPAEFVRYKFSTSTWTPWVQQVTQMLAADLTLHVNATSGDDSNDGLTAATALKTISAALAKIPRDHAGHKVTIALANGTYSAVTVSGLIDTSLTITNENSSNVSSVIVPGITISGCLNAFLTVSYITLTGNFSVNRTDFVRYFCLGCVFNGATCYLTSSHAMLQSCTFRNISGTAIVCDTGMSTVWVCTIESTCAVGVSSSKGIVTVSGGTNSATTPYSVSDSGRIFVNGRTYHENPGRVSLMTSTQGTQIQSALTTINLSENAPQYSMIEISIYPGTTTDARGIIVIDGYALTAASSMYFPLVLNGAAGGVVHITKNGASTTSFKIQATHPSYSVIRIESVYAINT